MRCAALLGALGSLAAASPALANGGCMSRDYLGAAAGQLRPVQLSTVRLVSEELTLALVSQRGEWRYTADARYTLSNPGPAVRVQYAVPIVAASAGVSDPLVCGKEQDPGATAASIRLSVAGGPQVGCTYHPQPELPRHARPAGLAITGAGLDRGNAQLEGYCTADLEIPGGKAVELRLEYTAPLFSSREDPGSSKECGVQPVPPRCGQDDAECARVVAEARAAREAECKPPPPMVYAPSLYYPMGLASTWAGPPSLVSVAVRLGAFAWDAAASRGLPEGAAVKGGTLRFGWRAPDLRGMDFTVALQPRAGPPLGRADYGNPCLEFARWPVPRPRAPLARASSTLVDQFDSYEPQRAADHDATTAWCVNTPDGGVGEWIELTWPRDEGQRRPARLYLLPGLGASQRLWTANGRVKRIRYGPCSPGATLAEAPLALAEVLDDALVEVPGDPPVLSESDAGSCLHLEIAEVAPGAKSRDVCLSEITVVAAPSSPPTCY